MEEFKALATSYKVFHLETAFSCTSLSAEALIYFFTSSGDKKAAPSLVVTGIFNLRERRPLGFSS
jgi:hypothetical protein